MYMHIYIIPMIYIDYTYNLYNLYLYIYNLCKYKDELICQYNNF